MQHAPVTWLTLKPLIGVVDGTRPCLLVQVPYPAYSFRRHTRPTRSSALPGVLVQAAHAACSFKCLTRRTRSGGTRGLLVQVPYPAYSFRRHTRPTRSGALPGVLVQVVHSVEHQTEERLVSDSGWGRCQRQCQNTVPRPTSVTNT
eukprot:354126-Chlamydomonas_euryale.AAC.3